MRTVHVRCKDRATSLGDRIEVAETGLRRMWGLLGRRSLAAGQGLWIKPSSGVHTVGMQFPIDVIGLDKEGRIMRLWNALAPFRVTSVSLRMRSVLELPAGSIAAAGLCVGDRITMERTETAA